MVSAAVLQFPSSSNNTAARTEERVDEKGAPLLPLSSASFRSLELDRRQFAEEPFIRISLHLRQIGSANPEEAPTHLSNFARSGGISKSDCSILGCEAINPARKEQILRLAESALNAVNGSNAEPLCILQIEELKARLQKSAAA